MWICKNQLGRRNQTDAQKTYLIGRQYEAQKMTVGGDRSTERAADGKFTASAQNGPVRVLRTAEIVAKEHGIGCNTVKWAAKFSKGVDAAEKIESGARDAISRVRARCHRLKENVILLTDGYIGINNFWDS